MRSTSCFMECKRYNMGGSCQLEFPIFKPMEHDFSSRITYLVIRFVHYNVVPLTPFSIRYSRPQITDIGIVIWNSLEIRTSPHCVQCKVVGGCTLGCTLGCNHDILVYQEFWMGGNEIRWMMRMD